MFNIESIITDSNQISAGFSGEIINERSERIGKINLGITFANTPKANLVFLSDSSDDDDDSDDEDFVYKYKNMNNETKNMFKTQIGQIGSRLNIPVNQNQQDKTEYSISEDNSSLINTSELEKNQLIESSSDGSLPTVIGNESEIQIPHYVEDGSEHSSIIKSDINAQPSQDSLTNQSSSIYSKNSSNITVNKSTTKKSTNSLSTSVSKEFPKIQDPASIQQSTSSKSIENKSITKIEQKKSSKSLTNLASNLETFSEQQVPKKQSSTFNNAQSGDSFSLSKKESDNIFGQYSSTICHDIASIANNKSTSDLRSTVETASPKITENKSITKIEQIKSHKSLNNLSSNVETVSEHKTPKKQSSDVTVNHAQIDNIFPLSKKESDHLFGQYSSTICHDMTSITSNQSESIQENQRKRAVKPKPLDESSKSRTITSIKQDSINEESRSREGLADRKYSTGSLNDDSYEPSKQSIKNNSNQSESVLNNQRKRAVKPKPLDESTKSRSRVLITQDSFNEESRSRNGLEDTIYSIGSLNDVIYESTKSIKNDEDEDLEVTMKFAHENGKISKSKFTLYNDETEKQYTSEYLPNLKADIRRKRSNEITDEATKVIIRLYKTVQEHDGEAAKDSEQFLGKYELILNNNDKKKKYKFHDIGKENLVTVKLSRSYASAWKKVIDKWQ